MSILELISNKGRGAYKRKYQKLQQIDEKEERDLARARIAQHEHYATPRGRYVQYKRRGKEKNQPFKLILEEFTSFWQKPCYYCGNEIVTIGLDKINNDIGYQMDNIVSCC